MLGFLFSHKTREKQFDPSYQELLADYLETRQSKYKTPWARRWIAFCLAFRTVQLVIQCSGTAWKATILTAIVAWGPEWLGNAIREIFKDW